MVDRIPGRSSGPLRRTLGNQARPRVSIPRSAPESFTLQSAGHFAAPISLITPFTASPVQGHGRHEIALDSKRLNRIADRFAHRDREHQRRFADGFAAVDRVLLGGVCQKA